MGGENVSAQEIERVILAVSGVREVAVVGRPDPFLDEVPVAFLLATDPADPTLVERVTAACGQTLATFKRPRAVRVLEEFPRVTLEKVAKAELRTMATQSR